MADRNIHFGLVNGRVVPFTAARGKVPHARYNTSDLFIAQDQLPLRQTAVVLSNYIETPSRFASLEMHGMLFKQVDAGTLNAGAPINFETGISKLALVFLAGGTPTGTITITGNSVDRATGDVTVGDSETIYVSGLATDSSTTDAEGNPVYEITDAYISSKWYTGTISVTTSTASFTDVDIYQVGFEQFNLATNVRVTSVDITIHSEAIGDWIYGTLYHVEVYPGNRLDIHTVTTFGAVSTDSESILRIQRQFAQDMDCTTDGIFMTLFLGPSPVNSVANLNVKVWALVGDTYGT